MSAARPGA